MRTIATARLLAAPSAAGFSAVCWGFVAVLVPTVVLSALDDIVTGAAVVPFVPSVLLSAIFLGTRLAGGVALGSAAVADALFVGPPNQLLEGPSDIFAVLALLIASAVIIGFVAAARRHVCKCEHVAAKEHPGGIVFSAEDGQAWASWYGKEGAVHLGPRDEVAEMMADFVKQVEFGKRLTGETRP